MARGVGARTGRHRSRRDACQAGERCHRSSPLAVAFERGEAMKHGGEPSPQRGSNRVLEPRTQYTPGMRADLLRAATMCVSLFALLLVLRLNARLLVGGFDDPTAYNIWTPINLVGIHILCLSVAQGLACRTTPWAGIGARRPSWGRCLRAAIPAFALVAATTLGPLTALNFLMEVEALSVPRSLQFYRRTGMIESLPTLLIVVPLGATLLAPLLAIVPAWLDARAPKFGAIQLALVSARGRWRRTWLLSLGYVASMWIANLCSFQLVCMHRERNRYRSVHDTRVVEEWPIVGWMIAILLVDILLAVVWSRLILRHYSVATRRKVGPT